ncbi:Bicyclomycin resistance protein [Aquimixticola soesokkakensis]|uniref:Bicyclomycin resistance protein n=1 Tax=Aquimixticola soesokkakensis TaxID=1519096 RepID=A0A1Y5SHH7_9RHOB|nr:multidrug effflux MFS transporter [Aquimixticola soesokkakensis]SLN40913.1 Bicyclomycin resistance protein [Aquimixticola soesokkakensis]
MPRRLSDLEFVVMLAFLFAMVAFSIDSMLPSLPAIADELTPDNINKAQLVLTAFMAGMGVGTFVVGPISDAVGRKMTITAGIAIYIVGAVLAARATSLEGLLVARALQGLGAASPRIVALAMVRDLYKGREMARITSFFMMIFIMIPALAPAIGTGIVAFSSWRGVFVSYAVLGVFAALWLNLRQPETLDPTERRAISARLLKSGVREVLSNKMVMLILGVLILGFGQMFAMLSSTQQIYDQVFDKAASFPFWFAGMALLAGTGTIVNATLVNKIGMRRLAIAAYIGQTFISCAYLAVISTGLIPQALDFPLYFAWSVTVYFMVGITFGNLNALALEPLGHMAGLGSSVIGALSTVGAVLVAAPIGLAFNGSYVPLVLGTFCCSGLAWLLMSKTRALETGAQVQPAE